ncbi:MAG: hypothetical protein KF886_09530 [Candidatus Hydrogenedentes bacterium]|nr:hypothetical protein [Candidatus Hydrogenedentota bacterium]
MNEEDDADGASGDLARTYINGANTMEQVEATLADVGGTDPAAGGYRHYALDHLGSVRGLFDGSRAAVASAEYGPYGAAYAASGPAMPQAFTGKPYDGASGLHYFPYRYYSAAQLRWVTRDPMEMVDGPNVYLYVAASPVRLTDALGLASGDTCGIPGTYDFIWQGWGSRANFRGCCFGHDLCYYRCGGHLNCDRIMRGCQMEQCKNYYWWDWNRYACFGVVEIMHGVLRSSIGQVAYAISCIAGIIDRISR